MKIWIDDHRFLKIENRNGSYFCVVYILKYLGEPITRKQSFILKQSCITEEHFVNSDGSKIYDVVSTIEELTLFINKCYNILN